MAETVGPPALDDGAGLRTNPVVQIYGQLVDRAGRPAAGVGMELVNTTRHATLAVTASDANGAFVLTISGRMAQAASGNGSADTTDTYQLLINGNGKPVKLAGLPKLTPGLHGPVQIVVSSTPVRSSRVAPVPVLMGEEQDLLDAFKGAPSLFQKSLAVQEPSSCSPYSPPSVASRVLYYEQVVMFRERVGSTPDASERFAVDALDLTQGWLSASQARPRYGAILEFRQEWREAGYGLGDLLYSVPLAPCEETKIATVDWRRKDWATKQTVIDESAFQDTTISRDEAINEVARMISDKSVHGSDIGGGAALTVPYLSVGGAAEVTDMKSTVDATTRVGRSINDRIRQVSNTLRNTRSFAVVEATQEEQTVVQTRVLRNHNHCHTVTFQYFQVLRHYLLRTELNAQPRPAVFLPFKPMTFTLELVSQHAYLLRRALLDPTLQPALDMLLGVVPIPRPTPATAPASTGAPASSGSSTGRVTQLQLSAFISYMTKPINRTSVVQNWPADVRLILNDREQAVTPVSLVGARPATGTFTPAQPIDPQSIAHLGIANFSGDDYWFDDLTITATVDGRPTELLFRTSVELGQDRAYVVELAALAGAGAATAPATIPGLDRLLQHLNANSLYYTGVVLAAGDSGRRYVMLAGINDAAGIPYSEIVENRVAGFIGNFAAFPLRSPDDLPRRFSSAAEADLTRTRDERLITLPSPGVFAESQLGQCSACEVIDNTRFWDWTKSPCPDEAPEITAAMLASRSQDLAKLLEVPQPSLNPPPVQVPAEPEPMIKIDGATMANLTKDLDLTDAKGVLDLVKGLAQIALDSYKASLEAVTKAKGDLQPGQGGLSPSSAAGAGGIGAGAVDGTAGMGDLMPTEGIALA